LAPVGAAILLLPLFGAYAQTGQECKALVSPELNKLEKSYSRGDIRVFYTERVALEGIDHRLVEPSRKDADRNGIPDIVQDIATQADVARRAYVLLGFREPLASPRYGRVSRIDINILDMPQNGLAYDNPVRYPDAPGRGDACTLRIDISSKLEAQARFTTNWFVVAHELFHVFQNGYTQFKRPWISEPTAKWAEYALRKACDYPLDARNALPVVKPYFERNIVAAPNGKESFRFWSRLVELAGTAKVLPEGLARERYTDGQVVLKDRTVQGAGLILALYRRLDETDDVVSRMQGWDPLAWPEKEQESSARDRVLLDAVQKVVAETDVRSDEISAFLEMK